jgi:hypothetical protein
MTVAASRVWPGTRADFVFCSSHISSRSMVLACLLLQLFFHHLGAVISSISNTFDKFLNMVSTLVWSVIRLGTKVEALESSWVSHYRCIYCRPRRDTIRASPRFPTTRWRLGKTPTSQETSSKSQESEPRRWTSSAPRTSKKTSASRIRTNSLESTSC